MTEKKWAYLDPRAPRRDKLVKVGGEAAWYWACGLCYCRDSDRDKSQPGFIPDHRAFGLYEAAKRPRSLVKKLVDSGLWLKAEGGYLVAGYGEIYGKDPIAVLVDGLAAPSAPAAAELTGRAKAGQAGGLARAAKHRALASQARESLLTKPGGDACEASPVLSFQVGSDLDSEIREIPKENPPPKGLSGTGAGDARLEDVEEFLRIPVRDRATRVAENEALARHARPHLWPEVIGLAKLFAATTGHDRNLTPYERDSGVRRLVSLLAAFDHEALVAILPRAVSTPWWREKPLRPLAHLSIDVVEAALSREAEAERTQADRVRRLRPHLVSAKPAESEISAAENAASAQAALEALNA